MTSASLFDNFKCLKTSKTRLVVMATAVFIFDDVMVSDISLLLRHFNLL